MTRGLEEQSLDDLPERSLEMSKEVSTRLSVAARKLRFSTSSRSNLYQAVGLRPRLADKLFKTSIFVVTILSLLVPNAIAIAYYSYFASDQYESEVRFTVRSSTPALGRDQLAKVTGIPAAKIVQDTQIVVNFIKSHEMLDVLQKKINLNDIYGLETTDWWARLPADATAEETLEYWEDTISTSVNPSSGIVTVKLRAFKPEDSVLLLREVLDASEKVVNQVNDRIWKDVSGTAQVNFDSAKLQLKKARESLADARNKSGILSVEGSNLIVSNLITTIEAEKLKLQQRYDSQVAVVSKSAPQLKVLQREIESKEKQIIELNAKLAGEQKSGQNLADVSQDLSQLQLAQDLAEQQFSASVKTIEQVQFVSRQQLLYLDSFLSPRVAEEATYPKRWLRISVIFISSLVLWGTALTLLHLVRKQFSA